jgi:hypothetical protein
MANYADENMIIVAGKETCSLTSVGQIPGFEVVGKDAPKFTQAIPQELQAIFGKIEKMEVPQELSGQGVRFFAKQRAIALYNEKNND